MFQDLKLGDTQTAWRLQSATFFPTYSAPSQVPSHTDEGCSLHTAVDATWSKLSHGDKWVWSNCWVKISRRSRRNSEINLLRCHIGLHESQSGSRLNIIFHFKINHFTFRTICLTNSTTRSPTWKAYLNCSKDYLKADCHCRAYETPRKLIVCDISRGSALTSSARVLHCEPQAQFCDRIFIWR